MPGKKKNSPVRRPAVSASRAASAKKPGAAKTSAARKPAQPKPAGKKPAAQRTRPSSGGRPPTSGTGAPLTGAWVALASRVAGVLGKLQDEDALILSRHGRRYFVQATGSARTGIRAEAVSNGYITNDIPLDRAEIARLIELGWSAPTHTPEVEHGPDAPDDGSPNYYLDLAAPVKLASLATLLAMTLRDVYGAADPGELRYQAFDDEGDPLIFNEIGLPREEPDADDADDLATLVFTNLEPAAFESAVRETAQQVLDGEALSLEGGAYAFETPEGFLFVEPVLDPRLVRIVTHLGAISVTDAAVHAAVAGANDVLQFGRVVAGDGTVLFLIELLAEPFVPMHVAEGIAAHRSVSGELRQLLAPILTRPGTT